MSWVPGMLPPHLYVDFDGTMADSDEIGVSAMYDRISEILCSYNLAHPLARDEFTSVNAGRVFGDLLCEALGMFHLDISEDELALEISRMEVILTENYRSKIKALPSVREAFLAFTEGGLNISVVSSTEMNRLLFGVTVIGMKDFVQRYFSAVSSLSPPRPKPAPDVYLFALKETNGNPEAALAIEDSPHGVASAVGAGIATIGFTGAVKTQLRQRRAIELRNAGAFAVAESWDEVAYYVLGRPQVEANPVETS